LPIQKITAWNRKIIMERYEKYKDSGVEWIGKIPEEVGS